MSDRNSQPSLFDQLTPSEALREDLAWLSGDGDADRRPRPSRQPRSARPPAPPKTHGLDGQEDTLLLPVMGAPDASERPGERTVVMPPVTDTDTDAEAPAAVSADEPRTPKTVRRILVALAVVAALILAMFAIRACSLAVRNHASEQRLSTALSSLASADRDARAARAAAGKAGLKDDDALKALGSRISANARITRTPSEDLTRRSRDALSEKAGKAAATTRSLTRKVRKATADKPVADARAAYKEALRLAGKAADGATASDDATRDALTALKAEINRETGLGAKSTPAQWRAAARTLDTKREALTKAIDAKRKADEAAARRKQEEEQQAQQQAQQQQQPLQGSQSTPRRYTGGSQYTYRGYGGSSGSSGSTSGGSSTGGSSTGNSSGSSGWYVPPATSDDGLPKTDPSL